MTLRGWRRDARAKPTCRSPTSRSRRHDVTRALSHATAAAAARIRRRLHASANCRRAPARTSWRSRTYGRRSRTTPTRRRRWRSRGCCSPRRRTRGGGRAGRAVARVARRRSNHGGGPTGASSSPNCGAFARRSKRELAEALAAGQDTPARRRLLAALLKRLLPPMYRDANADDARTALGRSVLRPLLEIVTEADQTPERAIIDLDRHAGQWRRGARAGAARDSARRNPASTRTRARRRVRSALAVGRRARTSQLAALVALARLGDPRGAPRVRALRDTDGGSPLSRHRDLGSGPPRRRACGARADQGARRPAGRSRGGRLPRSRPPAERRIAAAAVLAGSGHAAADRNAARRDHRAGPRVRAQRRRPQQRVAGAARARSIPAIRNWHRRPRWRWHGPAIRAALFPLLSRALLPHRFALSDASVPLRSAGGMAGIRALRRTRRGSSPGRRLTSTRCWPLPGTSPRM